MDDTVDSQSTDTNWPVELEGVTETVVTTLGPNGRWNAAALGLFGADSSTASNTVTARTWGNTRTRRNFHREGEGFVQFTRDPIDFVDAALSISELDEPVLDSAAAVSRVTVESIDSGSSDGTQWEEWSIEPVESTVIAPVVPTIDRGFAAVVEATVTASRLGVSGYDDDQLRERLDWCASIVERAGSERERTAFERVERHVTG